MPKSKVVKALRMPDVVLERRGIAQARRSTHRIGRFIDRCLLPVFPGWAMQRARARGLYDLMGAAYDAAVQDRTTHDWQPINATGDALAFSDLATLIARSRDLARNTSHGRAVTNAYCRNVIGATGVLPVAAAVDQKGEDLSEINEELDELFDDWACTPELCDVEGKITFREQQRLAIVRLIEDGELFFRLAIDSTPGRPSSLILQRFEVDQLDQTLNEHKGNEVRRGIEVDRFKRPVAYHLLNEAVNDLYRWPSETQRIPADQVCHLFFCDRVGQTHGIPLAVAVMRRMRDLGEYDAWELYAARVQAAITLLISREYPDSTVGLTGESGEDTEDERGNEMDLFEAGMTFRARTGEKVSGMAPTRPAGAYEPYVTAQTRQVGAGTDLSYEALARDHSRGTYSGQRQGMLQDGAVYAAVQAMIRDRLCRYVWRMFIRGAVLAKSINLPNYWTEERRYVRAEWIKPGLPWIDPESETNAWDGQVKGGYATLQEVWAIKGGNWRRGARQRAREQAFLRKLGLNVESTSPTRTGRPAGEPDKARPQNGRRLAERLAFEIGSAE